MAIFKQEQFQHWRELLAPSSLSILLLIYLLKDFLRHAPAIQICASFVWLLMGISLFFVPSDRMYEEKLNKTVSLEYDRAFYKKWFTKKLLEVALDILITIFIWSLIMLTINNVAYSPNNSSDSIFYYGGSILTSSGIVCMNAITILKLAIFF